MRAGAGGHALEDEFELEVAGLDQVGVKRRECGLEARDAERRLLEGSVLLVPGVRRVIGRDAGDVPSRRPRAATAGRPPSAAAGSSSGWCRVCARCRRSGRGDGARPRRSRQRRAPALHVPRPRTPALRDALYAEDAAHMQLSCSHARSSPTPRPPASPPTRAPRRQRPRASARPARASAPPRGAPGPCGHGAVLERAVHQARRDDRMAVVGEACCSEPRELRHLGELLPRRPFEIEP